MATKGEALKSLLKWVLLKDKGVTLKHRHRGQKMSHRPRAAEECTRQGTSKCRSPEEGGNKRASHGTGQHLPYRKPETGDLGEGCPHFSLEVSG